MCKRYTQNNRYVSGAPPIQTSLTKLGEENLRKTLLSRESSRE